MRAGARALEGKSEVRSRSSVGGKREGVKMWVAMSVWRNLLRGKTVSFARSRREHMMEDGRSGKDEAQNGVMD